MSLISHVHEDDRNIGDLHAHFFGVSSILGAMSVMRQKITMTLSYTADIRSSRYIGLFRPREYRGATIRGQ